MRHLETTVVAAALLVAGPAFAQNASQRNPPQNSQLQLSEQEQQFLNRTAQENTAEIRSALLAQEKAQDPAVKAFARLMVDDHTSIANQLGALFEAEHRTPTAGSGEEGQQMMSKFESAKGQQFDTTYMQAQVEGHQKMMSQFQQEEGNAKSAAVRAFLTMTLPTVEQHLALAQAIESSLQGKNNTVGHGTSGR
jgi:putative membrane protein